MNRAAAESPKAGPIRAGVVGLGVIGGGVARSLHNSGHRAVVYDVDDASMARLADVASPVSSPAEVARASSIIHLAVVDYPQARQALEGPDGILAGAAAGTIVAVLSTLAIPDFHALAQLGESAGVAVIDCGVARGDLAAMNGLVAMVGGEKSVVERARPTMEAWAKELVYCGRAGTGMATKIARNAVTFGMWRVLEEAARIAEVSGASEESLFQAIRSSDPEGELLFQWRSIRAGFPLDPQSRERELGHSRTILTKDLAAAHALAVEGSLHSPTLDSVRANIEDTLAAGSPGES